MIDSREAWRLIQKHDGAEVEKVILAAVEPARFIASLIPEFFMHRAGLEATISEFCDWVTERYPALEGVIVVVGPHNLDSFFHSHTTKYDYRLKHLGGKGMDARFEGAKA